MEEKVFIKNSKGLKLALIIFSPDKNKKYPAIIILNGFLGYKEELHPAELAKKLVNNGFTAVRFDCSGSGESEGAFEKDYSMSNYLEDIKCVYEYVQKLEFVDKNRIGVLGYSLGGMMAIVFAAQHSEIKTCIAVSTPPTIFAANWLKMFLKDWRYIEFFNREIPKATKKIKLPVTLIMEANKFNVLNFIPKVNCPFLMILGLADELVSPDDSRKIFKKANQPKELIEIEGLGHEHKLYPEKIKIVNEKTLDFLKRYL